MILETAFSLLLGGVAIVGIAVFRISEGGTVAWYVFVTAGVYLFISWLASKNGVDRIRAHDKKLLVAVRSAMKGDENGLKGFLDECVDRGFHLQYYLVPKASEPASPAVTDPSVTSEETR